MYYKSVSHIIVKTLWIMTKVLDFNSANCPILIIILKDTLFQRMLTRIDKHHQVYEFILSF